MWHLLASTAGERVCILQETKQAESIQEWILKPGTSRCCSKCLRGEQRADAAALVQTYACRVCKKKKAMKFFTKRQVLSLVELDEVQGTVSIAFHTSRSPCHSRCCSCWNLS